MFLSGQVLGRQASEVTVEMEPLLDNPVAAGDAVAALRRYSLLSPAGNGLVLVHLPGSGRHPRATLSDAGARWRQAAAVLVEEAVPADPTAPGGGRVGVRAAAAARAGSAGPAEHRDGAHRALPRAQRQLSTGQDLSLLIADAHMADTALGPGRPPQPRLLDRRSRRRRGRPRPARRPDADPRTCPRPGPPQYPVRPP
jgi:hypothetical protein